MVPKENIKTYLPITYNSKNRDYEFHHKNFPNYTSITINYCLISNFHNTIITLTPYRYDTKKDLKYTLIPHKYSYADIFDWHSSYLIDKDRIPLVAGLLMIERREQKRLT